MRFFIFFILMVTFLSGCAAKRTYLDDVIQRISNATSTEMMHSAWNSYEGTTVAKITILKDGTVEKVSFVNSSGQRQIDDALLKVIKDISPLPPPPLAEGKTKDDYQVKLIFGKMKKPDPLKVSTSGGLSADAITRAISAQLPKLKNCFSKPGAVRKEATLVLAFRIDPSGQAKHCGIKQGTIDNRMAEECTVSTLCGADFPKSAKPTDVSYPIHFKMNSGK
jgi:TonB family protein